MALALGVTSWAAAKDTERRSGESDLAFATRALALAPDSRPNVTAATWNGQPTLFVDYETGAYADEPERPLVALVRQPSGAWRPVKVTLGETEGGRPNVAAIAFANADRDPAKELIVILEWADRHATFVGALYEVRILDDAKPGAAALQQLKISGHFGSACDCTWDDGRSNKFRYKTAAAVKAELKRLGY